MIIIEIDNNLTVHNLNQEWIEWLRDLSTFHLRDGVVQLYSISGNSITIPRGFEVKVLEALQKVSITPEIIDNTYKGEETGLKINPDINYTTGDFYYQAPATDFLLKHRTARMEAPTGSGKTLMGCIGAAKHTTGPFLFLTMQNNLINQFKKTAAYAFSLPLEEIGIIQGSKVKIKNVTVGSLPTMGSKRFLAEEIHKLKNKFSVVFFDECHRSKALTYRDALMELNPQLLYGISATPDEIWDEEALRMMESLLGPIVLRIEESDIPNRITPECYVKRTKLPFKYQEGNTETENHWLRSQFHKRVSKSKERNNLVVNDVLNILNHDESNQILLCTSLVEHSRLLYKMLTKAGVSVCFPYSEVKDYTEMKKHRVPLEGPDGRFIFDEKGKQLFKKDEKGKIVYTKTCWKWSLDEKLIEQSVKDLEEGKARVLMGTYNAFTEGFDCKSLNTVLLVGPVSGRNRTRNYQLVGRCARKFKDKHKVFAIYYQDDSFPTNKLEEWGEAFRAYCTEKWANCTKI